MKKDRLSPIIFCLFLACVLGTLAFYCFYARHTKNEPQLIGECSTLTDWTYESQSGKTGSFVQDDALEELKLPAGEVVTYSAVLPEDIENRMWISFATGIDYEVYIDGVLRKAFYESEVDLPGGIEKSVYFFLQLTAEDAGKPITMIRCSETGYNGNFPRVYFGDGYGIIFTLFSNYIWFLSAILMLLIVAGAGMVAGLALRLIRKRTANIFYFSMGVFTVCLWLTFDNPIYQLVFQQYFIDGPVSFMMAVLAPFPFITYMDRLQRERYHSWHSALQVFELVYFVGICLIHYLLGYGLNEHLMLFNLPIAMIVLIETVLVMYDLKKKLVDEYHIILHGFVGLMILSIIDIVLLNTVEDRVDGTLILAGLYLLSLAALVQQIQEFSVLTVTLSERNVQLDTLAKRAKASMERSFRDPLTGLHNSRFLKESLGELLIDNPQGAFLMIDLDNFKSVNDTFGHMSGDHLLVAFADSLRGAFRNKDIICRLGGDEFVVFMPDEVSRNAIRQKYQQIRDSFQASEAMQNFGKSVNLSMGVAFAPENGLTMEALYRAADEAMYSVKKSGKDGFRFA